MTTYSIGAATGIIAAGTIDVTVPYGTNRTALVATFTSTGVTVKVGSTDQRSGVTSNDFSSPVSYVVQAEDGSVQTYTVSVNEAPSSAKSITSFSIGAALGSINGSAIAVTVPFGTSLVGLVPTFTSTGAEVRVGSVVQVSGVTANDFSSPVTYEVVAADGSSQVYTVTVNAALSPHKDLTSFSIGGHLGTIDGTSVAVTMPGGTDVTSLVASFTSTGGSVTVGSQVQESGVSSNDFTNPVVYQVFAADGSSQDYTVTVSVDPLLFLAGNYVYSVTFNPNPDSTSFPNDSESVIASFTIGGLLADWSEQFSASFNDDAKAHLGVNATDGTGTLGFRVESVVSNDSTSTATLIVRSTSYSGTGSYLNGPPSGLYSKVTMVLTGAGMTFNGGPFVATISDALASTVSTGPGPTYIRQ